MPLRDMAPRIVALAREVSRTEIMPRWRMLDSGDSREKSPGDWVTIADVSAERSLRDWFARADLVIAKGQGNYETLSEVDKNLYFLFTVKCPLVSARVGEPVGSLVAKPGRRLA